MRGSAYESATGAVEPCPRCGGPLEDGQDAIYLDYNVLDDQSIPQNYPTVVCSKTCAIEEIREMPIKPPRRRGKKRSQGRGQPS